MAKGQNLVSKAKLATMRGTSRAAVTLACKGALGDALDGDRIDLNHPAAEAYLGKPKTGPKPSPDRPPASDDSGFLEMDGLDGFESIKHLTILEVRERFGTERRFKDLLDACKKLEDIRGKELENAKLEGSLVSRELVRQHVFSALEAGNLRLLQDLPKAIARRLYDAARADSPIEEAERVVRNLIEKQLEPIKRQAAKGLRNA